MKLKIRRSFQSLFNFFLFLISLEVYAAACCGGGFAAPSLIVGDDKAQMTTSYVHSQVTDDVGADSFWRRRDTKETSDTIKLEGAHIFLDRWQAGASVPLIRRNRGGEESTGFGDVAGTLGYEYLPDWDYNPWRPRGLGFFQLTLPTGKSINEADSTYQLDSRGRGFWALGVGTILTKTIERWDVFANFDIHKSFNKKYSNAQSQGTLKPNLGGNFGLGAGYSVKSVRLGTALTWTYEDPVRVDGSISSHGSLQRYATSSLSVSYLFQEEWAATLAYTNQKWFGSPVNTSLGESLGFFLQKRWQR